ncbi:MAG: [protein-PII] uridylyltransferase family protein, partial [Planctomycetota bacterium]
RNFERVVLALGAPATFFQLLAEYPDILSVFTDLCGWSQHLSSLLVRNPAMIDAFADSLVVAAHDGWQPWDDLPLESIEKEEDPERVLHDLKDLSLLRIGVRDIQGKANTENTLTDLTLTAERVLALAIEATRAGLYERHGPPAENSRAALAVLGLGKLGAREMGYASDLDLCFVMDAEGRTEGGMEVSELLSRLAQGVVRLLGTPRERGRLYQVDARLRPDGRSGPLVTPLERFARYYAESARVAELQMLTKGRVVAGDEDLGRRLSATVERILYEKPPGPGIAREVREMRRRLEEASRGRDVKRGFGGIVDIEFLVECLKLGNGHARPALRTPGTLSALEAARRERLLTGKEHETLLTAMQFLRSVESRMRIVYDMARARIPDSPRERGRLARRLGYEDTDAGGAGDALVDEYEYHTARTPPRTASPTLGRGSPVSGFPSHPIVI